MRLWSWMLALFFKSGRESSEAFWTVIVLPHANCECLSVLLCGFRTRVWERSGP